MPATSSFLVRYRQVILYSITLGLLLFLLKWLEIRLIVIDHALEIYVGSIAVIFTALGVWLALRLSKPKVQQVVVEKEIHIAPPDNFTVNTAAITELEISKRELEILKLMAKGHSNQEIAQEIFVSLSTVKTHNQNLFFKLDVKRRTQAIEKAKQLRIIQ